MKVECPSCARQVEAVEDLGKGVLLCPACEAEIPYESRHGAEQIVDEILPGIKPGFKLGAYEVVEFIGSGGMAVIVKGRQLSLNRIVAIKILPRRFARNRLFVKRFDQEAAAMASLNHHNIVNVIDRGKEGDFYFIVMEYIEGKDLKYLIARKGRLPQPEAIKITTQILAGLEYAHGKGVVHRDIKPGNIMISASDIVKVADFGLAHLAQDKLEAQHTHTGQTMGTLKYMAPEQLVDARAVDARADLYSTGVVLYEMLTGHLPVGAFKMPSEIARELDPRLDDVVLSALRSDPAERFKSAREFAGALQQIVLQPASVATQQREFEETDSTIGVEVGLSACGKCGRENPPEARECEGCGADLTYLFEPCPNCDLDARFDQSTCPGCGHDLAAAKQKTRRHVMQSQRRIKGLIAKREFDKAVIDLRELTGIKGPEYEEVRKSASIWLDKLEKAIERRNQQIYDAAQRMYAEADYEKAIDYLKQLPTDYHNAAELVEKVNERMESGRKAVADAQKAANEGDYEEALAKWEKAAELWPRDARIKNNIIHLRTRVGNRTLVKRYLDEAREAADKNDFREALDLCRLAADLAPDDSGVLSLMEQYQSEARALASDSDPLFVPGSGAFERTRRRKRDLSSLRKSFLLLLAAGFVALVVWMLIYITPTAGELAAARFNEAMAEERRGELEAALAIYGQLIERYPDSGPADDARAREFELRAIIDRCARLINSAQERASRDELVEAGQIYLELLRDPDCSRSISHAAVARDRLAGLRQRLIERGIEFERKLRPRMALELLGQAGAMVLESETPPAALVVAESRITRLLASADQLARRASTAIQYRRLDQAEAALTELIALLPTDERLPGLIKETLAVKPPPDGMIYIAPGEFAVKFDTEGRPAQPRVETTGGFYIDTHEATNERYARFVAETGAAVPRHWIDGRPPSGREKYPVANVSYPDAVAFAQWAGMRMPSETEWLRAAGGEEGRRYPWGDEWNIANAVSSAGPAPVGSAAMDISPAGVRDLGGNLSEWVSGAAGPVIMGGSFIGPETDRPMRPVFGGAQDGLAPPLDMPGQPPVEYPPLVATGHRENPVAVVLMQTNPLFTNPRISGTRDRAGVTIFRWLPEERELVSAPFVAALEDEIGGQRMVRITLPDRRETNVVVDFSTGCLFKGWREGRDDLIMLYRAPDGIQRETSGAIELDRTLISQRFIDLQTAIDLPMERSMSAAFQRSAPADSGYINVGFRCAKTPRLAELLEGALESVPRLEDGENQVK